MPNDTPDPLPGADAGAANLDTPAPPTAPVDPNAGAAGIGPDAADPAVGAGAVNDAPNPDAPHPPAPTGVAAPEASPAPLAVDSANVIPRGAFTIWVADKDGNLIDPPRDRRRRDREPNPANPDAVDIYFALEDTPQAPPTEQVELQLDIEKVLRAATQLYLKTEPVQLEKFKLYYVKLFRLAQLGLEGQNAVPAVARGALTAVTSDLIDDEAGRIKNGHLMKLGRYVIIYSLAFFLLYCIIYLGPGGWFVRGLKLLQVDPPLLASFVILWIGCFIGVWLSYGIRKSTFTLVDLTRAEEDQLAPHLRLLFAGLLAMIVGLLFSLRFVQVTIGTVSLTAIHSEPMLALLVGLFCGISELALPASIGTRARSFMSSLK